MRDVKGGRMLRTIKTLMITLILLPALAGAANVNAPRELVRLLSQYHTMTAEFQQQLLNGKGRIVRETSGTMAIKRPGKFRWETKRPDRQIIIANDNTIWIYDIDLQQAIRRHFKKHRQYSPVYLLTQRVNKLPRMYSVRLVRNNLKEKRFRLFPRYHNDNVQSIELSFSKNKLHSIIVLDGLGQRIYFNFKNVKLNPKISNQRFILDLSEEVDVITQ